MLVEISCDLFNQKTIKFHRGLNIVTGTELGANSIGKTLFLLIIDFIFGGTDYLKEIKPAHSVLGHHKFEFSFQFGKEIFTFCRGTQNSNEILKVNYETGELNSISLDDYKQFLKDNYLGNFDLSFRKATSLLSRIPRKKNISNPSDPLANHGDSNHQKSITTLFKLFEKFNDLEDIRYQIEKLEDDKKLYNISKKRGELTISNKQELIDGKKQLEVILNEIDALLVNEKITTSIEFSKDTVEKINKKNELVAKKNILYIQLTKINNLFFNRAKNISEKLNLLSCYIDGVNKEKIEKINKFHDDISSHMKSYQKKQKDNIVIQINKILGEIKKTNNEIEQSLNLKNNLSEIKDKLIKLIEQKQSLEKNIINFEAYQNIRPNLAKLEEDELKKFEDIKKSINKELSDEIYELSKLVFDSFIEFPKFEINNKRSYYYGLVNDTGTGRGFASLIIFDIALLSLTKLPYLIHDSILFDSIENITTEKLLFCYSNNKQSFIAIDKIKNFTKEAKDFIEEKTVISLSKEQKLFKFDWNQQENQNG